MWFKLIFGSTALKHWFPETREPKDIDYMARTGQSVKGHEYHWQEAFQYILDRNQDNTYVDPDFLYTIKVSHAAWDFKWDKTMVDVAFLKSKGCKLDPELYRLLYAEWEIVHYPKRLSLNKKNEEFFRADRKDNHDNLHLHFMFGDEPMHNKIRKDKAIALTSKALWDKLPYEDQIKCALEEIYVIAAERFKGSPANAFNQSLKTLITSATRGYFCLFLIENFDTLRKYDRTHYLTKYKDFPK